MDTLIFATQENLRDLCRSANAPSSRSRRDLVNRLLHLNPQIPDRDVVTEFEDVADDEDEDDLVKTCTFSSSTQFLENTVRSRGVRRNWLRGGCGKSQTYMYLHVKYYISLSRSLKSFTIILVILAHLILQ